MATIVGYTPTSTIAKALFNFDAFGLSNFRLSGTVNVSISAPFVYSQYLNGFGNNNTWTPDVPAVYWNTSQVDNINSVLIIYEQFIHVSFSSVSDHTNYSPSGVGTLTDTDINLFLISRADLQFAGQSSINYDFFGYVGGELDIFLNVDKFGSSDVSLSNVSFGGHAFMHELGHSLGLSHPHTFYSSVSTTLSDDFSATASVGFNKLGFVINSNQDMNKEYFTIMSYDDEIPTSGVNTYAVTPMILDVIALQNAYGVGSGTSGNGDDVITPGGAGGANSYRTYYDAGGTDRVDLSNYSSGAYLHMGTSIVSASHLVGVSMSMSDYGLMASGSDPLSLRWFYGEIENTSGGSGNDLIIGNSLNNFIDGGVGDDVMYGGDGNDTFDWDSTKRSGNDTMYGDFGDDIFVLNSVSDSVVELFGEGTDCIWTDFTFSLTATSYVEDLKLFGTSNINATGNDLSNFLSGNSGNNLLSGNSSLDTFIFNASENGTDTISDISIGEIIQIIGASFSGVVTEGNGSSAGLNQIEIERSGGITTLNIGTDSNLGADIEILLTGSYSISQFLASGQNIAFSSHSNSISTGSVSISGTVRQGQVLTASNTLSDLDGLGAIAYQWRSGGNNISGATDSTYTLTQAEVGKVIAVVASYNDQLGSAESVASNATVSVANVNDVATGSVSISGTAQQGQVLTASNTLADVDGLGTITYQWRSNGNNISDERSSTYTLTQTEVGKVITVVASYNDQLGSAEIVASGATASVANLTDSEVLTGTNFNETFRGGLGNDVIDGGASLDYAIFTGLSSQYSIQIGSNTTIADGESGRDGTDSLINVERLIFADTNIALDREGIAGQSYRIYEAVLGRAPDLEGLGYWINDMDNGVSLTTIAQGFIASPEFQGKYGANPSYETYINLLYNNILDRAPDTVGMNYWVSNMQRGIDSPAAVLASFSEGYENTANVAPDIANGIYYTPWIT
jgi:serralysin